MLLFNNKFSKIKEIKGFSQDEILATKDLVLRLKENKISEIEFEDFLKNALPLELLMSYEEYLERIYKFVNIYLLNEEKGDYYNLKTKMLDELNVIQSNLNNLNANARNIKRMVKKSEFIESYLSNIELLLPRVSQVHSVLSTRILKTSKDYEDLIEIWKQISSIKNENYKLASIPENLIFWNEIAGLAEFIKSLNEVNEKKLLRKSREQVYSIHFNEICTYFSEKYGQDMQSYTDLINLLFKNQIFSEYSGEEYINVLERKEVVKSLDNLIQPIILSLISDKLRVQIIEFKEYMEKLAPDDKDNVSMVTLNKLRYSDYLPKFINYYLGVIDKSYQREMNQLSDTAISDFEQITRKYEAKIDILASRLDEIDSWILKFDHLIHPHENLTDALKKAISNLNSEILRRKEEFENYLHRVKDEGLRVEIRKFVDGKIEDVTKLINNYEDETSLIIREELPQLKKIRELLFNYKTQIEDVKDQVYKELDLNKKNDIDLYNIIKHWEDTFNRKKRQLTFLLTVLMNKIFKSFKDLIDQESILFAEITEITNQVENYEGLPMNFALSAFLAERLTEDELRERITEINAKINQLNGSLGLYQVELSKLEQILSNKVKLREGIALSDVQCTVCHQHINFVKDKVITCPFCGSTYHYLCVAAWLTKYNSCPMCQNSFLEPYSKLFENGE